MAEYNQKWDPVFCTLTYKNILDFLAKFFIGYSYKKKHVYNKISSNDDVLWRDDVKSYTKFIDEIKFMVVMKNNFFSRHFDSQV